MVQALCRGVLLRKHLDEALLAARFEDEVDDFDYDQEIDLSLFNFDQVRRESSQLVNCFLKNVVYLYFWMCDGCTVF